MAEIQMKLLDAPSTKQLTEGSVAWMALGIALEAAQ